MQSTCSSIFFVFGVLLFWNLSTISESTLPKHSIHKWKAFANALRYIQETMLRTSLNRAAPNNGIVFECRTTTNPNHGNEFHFELKLGDMRGLKRLDPRRKLALFLHGWNDEGSKEWIQDLLKTWTYFDPNYSVCVVDWGHLSQEDYKTASMSIFDVGLTVASIIMSLEALHPRYISRSNITIAGYSLGAHAAGYAGAMLNGKVEQIIGLDPAGPLFTLPAIVSRDFRLDRSDAKFVQVLHTSGGTLGTSVKCGHADFYPNGGKVPQRHCTILFPNAQNNAVACSHSSSAIFFKQSMNPAYPFVGYNCNSYDNFQRGLCTQNKRGRFGIHSQLRSYGDFYFDTKPQSPFVQCKRSNQVAQLRSHQQQWQQWQQWLQYQLRRWQQQQQQQQRKLHQRRRRLGYSKALGRSVLSATTEKAAILAPTPTTITIINVALPWRQHKWRQHRLHF